MKRLSYLPLVLLILLLLPGVSTAQGVQGYIDQGITNSQAGHYDQALQAFDQALKLKPNDPALITYKGIVYYAKGNNAKALQLFDEAIKLNPNFARAYYQRGMVYQSQEKYKQAVPDLEKAKRLGYGVDPEFINLMKKRAAGKE
jgi:tetratricopeptide (TPR) repeat protein